MKHAFGLSAFAGAVLLAVAAQAATINIGVATVTLIDSSQQNAENDADFYAAGFAANTPVDATWSPDDPSITPPPNSLSGIYKSPFENSVITPGGDNGPTYFSVGAVSGGEGSTSPATLTLKNTRKSLDILWGSIDSYNTLSFFDAGNNLIQEITGTDIAQGFSLGGSPANFEAVALLNIVLPNFYKSIKFVSEDPNGTDRAAFEFALQPIPLPAAAWLMISALAGLGFMSRRRQAA